jgi:ATP/ADP translocase/HEAT repeat protein
MLKKIAGWLNIYEKELSLVLWTLALMLIVRSTGMILNNYAETAFLKRYGVEFLPIVTMLNAVITVIVMGFTAGLLQRFSNPTLLAATFIFSGISTLVLRLLIPMGIDLVYPILFMLKSLYELLHAMLFWNIANDLFNTRQSKRLFPLITASGVIGLIISSLTTPTLANLFRFDNLLIIYLIVCLAGATLVTAMTRRFPTLLVTRKKTTRAREKTSMLEEFRRVKPLLKESTLLRLMIVLTLMPNVVVPIMNYQFNYAADNQFASESGLIEFFSYFRSAMNSVSLIILLFVGKIYGRWGLPVALTFHPINYAIAFMAFLLRFDVLSAMYARMSTNILRTTINVPANAIMMGLFPEEFRAMVRPFLRGTVVRMGLFLGSSLILVSTTLFHPRYLSLVALPFVIVWIITPFILKRRYASILSRLIARNQLDFKSMEEREMDQLFRDRSMQKELVQAFLAATPDNVVWYARLLQSAKIPNLDAILMRRVENLAVEDQIALLALVSPQADLDVIPMLNDLSDSHDPRLTRAVLKAIHCLAPEVAAGFDLRPYLTAADPLVRAYAAAGLYDQAPETARRTISSWMEDNDQSVNKAGVVAAGLTGNDFFIPLLRARLESPRFAPLLPEILTALHQVGVHDMDAVMAGFFTHSDLRVRRAALRAYHVTDKESLKIVIPHLADPDPVIRDIAVQRIEGSDFQDGKTLIKSLGSPNRDLREQIFDLLDRLQIKDLDVFRFARNQIEGAYRYLSESVGVAALPPSPARDLLLAHLAEQRQVLVENVLRVLTIQDRTGRLRVITRGILGSDPRQRANGQEALDELLDHSLSKLLLPLLDEAAPEKILAIGRKYFKLRDFSRDTELLCNHLLGRDDPLTVLLTLQLIAGLPDPPAVQASIAALTDHANDHVARLAYQMTRAPYALPSGKEQNMPETLPLPNIILLLKNIEIFEHLSVSELSAVASATEQVDFETGQTVITQGDPGDTLYLIIEGEVAIIKEKEDDREIELDRIGAGDYFGEMALFEDIPRTATVRTLRPCRMLTLHKMEFKEMVREYPQIALEICKVLSGRIRKLHQKMATECEFTPAG